MNAQLIRGQMLEAKMVVELILSHPVMKIDVLHMELHHLDPMRLMEALI